MNNEDEIKKYWDRETTESMYDKNLLDLEISAIREQLHESDKIIDIGCGEGEGTVKYAEKVRELIALDFSPTRLKKLKARNSRITTVQMDMRKLAPQTLGNDFDKVITQRSLINLKNYEEQKDLIKIIHSLLKKSGTYILLEGFLDGADNINAVRRDFNLPPINVKWHNCFFQRTALLEFIQEYFALESRREFSVYFFMTRVFNAVLKYPEIPQWNDPINNLAARMENKYKSAFLNGLSRLEMWVLKKKG